MKTCNWCNLTDEEQQWLLFENEYWSVYLADEQDYIGRCILISKRHCGSISELTSDEWTTLKDVIDILEECFKTILGAELCNWSCLMNDFYKEEFPNPHLHIHVRPRYKTSVKISDNHYSDEEYGHHYKCHKNVLLSYEDKIDLYKLLKDYCTKKL